MQDSYKWRNFSSAYDFGISVKSLLQWVMFIACIKWHIIIMSLDLQNDKSKYTYNFCVNHED